MNRMRRLVFIVGSAILIVVGLACGTAEKQDSTNTEAASDAQQVQGQPESSGPLPEITLAVVPQGAPRVNMTYEGSMYHQDPLRTEEAANLTEDSFELVGSTAESNLIAPGSGESLDVYRLKGGDAAYLYTFESGESIANEDGTAITVNGEWVRWAVASQDPANDPQASDVILFQSPPVPTGPPREDPPAAVPQGAPLVSMTYEGAVYYWDSLSADEAANISEDDLELVGVSESNPLVPGSAAGWDVYKLKDGEEGYVYRFDPGESFKNEDGRTITIEPEWSRWSAVD
ncbi:MAG: hypothetical protein FI707_02305 [SAR202 cluster bacterium]|nr:hypothetical protein [Chloroflexota bacterium]MQG67608.1 hypothetical protein [SAR202 cluster bacterium]